MRHPIHQILKRYLDTEQFAFDASEHELWPSERFQSFHREPHPDGTAESQEEDLVYGERESEN